MLSIVQSPCLNTTLISHWGQYHISRQDHELKKVRKIMQLVMKALYILGELKLPVCEKSNEMYRSIAHIEVDQVSSIVFIFR